MAALGFVGVVLTQMVSAYRERTQDRRQQSVQAAERRVGTYVDFLRITEQLCAHIAAGKTSVDVNSLPAELWDVMTRVHLIAPAAVGASVHAVNDAVHTYIAAVEGGAEHAVAEARDEVTAAKARAIVAMQNELREAGFSPTG